MLSKVSDEYLEKIMRILWGFVLLTLPVTSFRWLPNVMGTTHVRPLSFFPLAVLIPVLIFYLIRTKSFRFPTVTAPLLGFIFVTFISTMIG